MMNPLNKDFDAVTMMRQIRDQLSLQFQEMTLAEQQQYIKSHLSLPAEMLPEYDFDYTQAKPNRFAPKPPVTVTLDPEVAKIFTTSEAVNQALKAVLAAIPKTKMAEF
jgi:hypothetical protein